MENVCDVNHLDADVLLPPRKRLLAGLKKQSPDGHAAASPSVVVGSYVTISEAVSSSSPSFSSEFETRLKNLLNSHSNNPNLTPEEVVEASKAAAVAATQAAKAARAAAEEKAEIAAKAVAAAKSALDLAASFPGEGVSQERNLKKNKLKKHLPARAAAEEKAEIAAKAVAAAKSALDLAASFPGEGVSQERILKKNKLKKHLPVQFLYKKNQPIENSGTDEELARKLHRAMNSSPRISKNSPNSESKGSKHKKPKSSSSFEITEGSDGGIASRQDCLSLNNGHAVAGNIDSEDSIQEVCSSKEAKKGSRYDKSNQMEIDNGEAESSRSKEKNTAELSPIGKKRGRVKLKKLPLSICTSKDRSQPKEGIRVRSSPFTEMRQGNHPVDNIPLFPVEPSTERVMPIEAASMWKCQEFKASACIKQNKAVQS